MKRALPEPETIPPDDRKLETRDLKGLITAGAGTRIYEKGILDSYHEDPEHTILMVTHDLTATGAPFALLSFAKMLRKKGWQVLVVSPEDGDLGRYAQAHMTPILYVPNLYRSDLIWQAENLFSAVIVNTIVCAPIICALNGTNTPVIWWIHEAGESYTLKMAREMPQRLAENIHVYCVGDYAERMLKKRMPQYKVGRLWFCVEDIVENTGGHESTFHWERLQNRKVYALVGSIQSRKGQDILLKAIAGLPDAVRAGSAFIFVGVSANRRMKAWILRACRKDPDMVMFYQGLEKEEVFELYRNMDYLICASRDEPGPLVVVEVMPLGKPCICSVNAGLAKIIEAKGAGLTYDRNDPHILSKRITESFNLSDEEYHRLSNNARAAYETCFSENVFGNNVERIMNSILRKNRF